MGSSHKTLLVNITSILSIMLYLMCLLIMSTDSATLSIHRMKTFYRYPSATAVHHKKGEFYVKMEVGGITSFLILDTGGTLIWVRCTAERRSIYLENHEKVIQSSDLDCADRNYFRDASGWCAYDCSYHDETKSQGLLVRDEFGAPVHAQIYFGCSCNTTWDSMMDGILGMSRGQHSFISQISNQYGQRFSFCLVSDTDELQRSYLRWGTESMIPSNAYVLKMLDGRVNSDMYDVPLIDILVGSDYVGPEAFNGGCVLDTGMAVSRLVPEAFYAIVKLMDEEFLPNGFTKIIKGSQQVCYDPTEEWRKIHVPAIWLRFKGVSGKDHWMRWGREQLFDMEPIGMGRLGDADCLQLLPSKDIYKWSTIGSFQMSDIHFAFDLMEKQIHYIQSPSCGYD